MTVCDTKLGTFAGPSGSCIQNNNGLLCKRINLSNVIHKPVAHTSKWPTPPS